MHSVRELTIPASGDLAALADLFDLYRVHYGQAAEPGRSAPWLADQLQTGRLKVFVAERNSAMVGFATVAPIPASLRLGHWWQIRDLFVAPEQRHLGIALALLEAIRTAAEASGALRLGLQTEADNAAALSLYREAGYTSVMGYQGLTLPLDGSRRA